jgi:hypothetical protein
MRAVPTYQIEVWCPTRLQPGAGLRLCLDDWDDWVSLVNHVFARSFKSMLAIINGYWDAVQGKVKRPCLGFHHNIAPPSLTLTYPVLVSTPRINTLSDWSLRGGPPKVPRQKKKKIWGGGWGRLA